MKDQRVYLKVKIKSLTAEAAIIRREEKRTKHMRMGLALHRRTVVRNEQRHTLLAYGFLLGRTYVEMERNPVAPPDWDKVRKMVDKYGIYWDSETPRADYNAAIAKQAARFGTFKPVEAK